MRAIVVLCIAGIILLSGCAAPGRATGTGAVLGAATGAAVGSFSANAGKGALLGAGVGALGGYLIDSSSARYHRGPAYQGGRRCAPGFFLNRRGRCVRY
jgi:hypothetical protein